MQPDERKTRISRAVVEVGKDIGRSPSQVALAWLRQQPGVVIPIIGARTAAQLKDNLGSVEFSLEGPHLKRLDEASRIELGFPQRLLHIGNGAGASPTAGCSIGSTATARDRIWFHLRNGVIR